MSLSQILDGYYLKIFDDKLTEPEVFEAFKNLTGFYGAIVDAESKSKK